MRVTIYPSALSGAVDAIPSKSDVHRLLVCSMLADRPVRIACPGTSRDIEATKRCLRAMGARIDDVARGMVVHPLEAPTASPELDCGESGSTLRFLVPMVSLLCGSGSFVGHGRLPGRPIVDLQLAMAGNGVRFSSRGLPFSLEGRLRPGVYRLPGDVSSQYVSALLMALPALDDNSVVDLTTPLESQSYVDITRAVLRRFGVRVGEPENQRYFVAGGQAYVSPGEVVAAGDWSNAACVLAAGALGDGTCVRGLDASSPQGDRKVAELLRRFGADVEYAAAGVSVRPGELRACRVDLSDMPDLLPVLAVVATAARGRTDFVHAARLRLKESDRLSATANLLRDLGGVVTEHPDGLSVEGGPLEGGVVDVCNDHRLVMAAALAATRCSGPVTFDGAEAIEKSYPTFFEDYEMLGGRVDVI